MATRRSARLKRRRSDASLPIDLEEKKPRISTELVGTSHTTYEGPDDLSRTVLHVEPSSSRATATGPFMNVEALPVTEKPFRLLDLPTEIRLEIYRACLVKPYDILLSRTRHGSPPLTISRVTSASDLSGENTLLQNDALRSTDAPAPPRRRQHVVRRRVSRTQGRPAHDSIQHQPIFLPPPTPAPQEHMISHPLVVALLRTNKQVYREARDVLYGENQFTLDLTTAQKTIAALHQRSRGQIRQLRVTVPSHSDIMEWLSDLVRLSLRYCSKLAVFTINMPFAAPDLSNGLSSVYSNCFDILRWLPKRCQVVLEGNIHPEVRALVDRICNAGKKLDEQAYARRQLMSNGSTSRA